MLQTIVLSHKPHGDSDIQNIIRTGREEGHEVTIINPTDCYLYASNNPKGYDEIHHKNDRLPKGKIDAIMPRIGKDLGTFGFYVVEHFSKNLGIYTSSSADGLRTASDKFLTSQKLSQKKVRIPKTVFAFQAEQADFLIKKVGL